MRESLAPPSVRHRMQSPHHRTQNPHDLDHLLEAIRGCRLCKDLPLGPAPIVQGSVKARILIAGQAPGRITHHKGIPFDDPSGERLRRWLGVDRITFYNPDIFAVVPMGFCFPGTAQSGDLPPRPECAATWHTQLLPQFNGLQLKLLIGGYAQAWHLKLPRSTSVTECVQNWRTSWPHTVPLPHPSPRNTRWLKTHSWFEETLVPMLQARIQHILSST